MTVTLDASANTVTICIPLKMRKRGGRKLILAPDGADWAPDRPQVDSAMVKALARAFRWRKLIETGIHATIDDLAGAERINPSYVSRLLRLTLLAPDIVEAILDGRQGAEVSLATLMEPFPVEWTRQRECRKSGCGANEAADQPFPPNSRVQGPKRPRCGPRGRHRTEPIRPD